MTVVDMQNVSVGAFSPRTSSQLTSSLRTATRRARRRAAPYSPVSIPRKRPLPTNDFVLQLKSHGGVGGALDACILLTRVRSVGDEATLVFEPRLGRPVLGECTSKADEADSKMCSLSSSDDLGLISVESPLGHADSETTGVLTPDESDQVEWKDVEMTIYKLSNSSHAVSREHLPMGLSRFSPNQSDVAVAMFQVPCDDWAAHHAQPRARSTILGKGFQLRRSVAVDAGLCGVSDDASGTAAAAAATAGRVCVTVRHVAGQRQYQLCSVAVTVPHAAVSAVGDVCSRVSRLAVE